MKILKYQNVPRNCRENQAKQNNKAVCINYMNYVNIFCSTWFDNEQSRKFTWDMATILFQVIVIYLGYFIEI